MDDSWSPSRGAEPGRADGLRQPSSVRAEGRRERVGGSPFQHRAEGRDSNRDAAQAERVVDARGHSGSSGVDGT